MKRIKAFFRREPVLVIAALAAAVSCCFVPRTGNIRTTSIFAPWLCCTVS